MSTGIRRNVLMLKILQSLVNDRIFLCPFLPHGRLKSSLTWREGWTDCPLRSLSQSVWVFESSSVVSSSMTQHQCLSSCGDREDRCLSMLNAALQFSPVTWHVNQAAKWTVAPVLRSQRSCPPWKSTRTAVSRTGRETEGKDRVREMAKMKEGESGLERKIAGHKTTVKLLLIIVMPIYWAVYSGTITCTLHVSSHLICTTTIKDNPVISPHFTDEETEV